MVYTVLHLELSGLLGSGRGTTQLLGKVIDRGQGHWAEVDVPVAIGGLGEADELPTQHFAEEMPLAAPLNLAVGAHPAYDIVSGGSERRAGGDRSGAPARSGRRAG